jgi:hypothetical protein
MGRNMQIRRFHFPLITFPIAALAEAPIDTNRPGFTSSPAVVTPGQWQIETGLDYTRGSDSTRTWNLLVAEFRLGVVEQLELFVNGISWSWQESDQTDEDGFKDIGLGVKYNLSGADVLFSTALLGQFSVPVGGGHFSSDRWDPTVAFIWSSNTDLAFSGTVKVSKFESGYQLDNGLKWVLPLGDLVTTFLEWEANLPEGGDDIHWMNLGCQLLTRGDTQLDANVGVGLNGAADDYRVGIGFSHRF